jgi:Flp pilus assembly protein TadD
MNPDAPILGVIRDAIPGDLFTGLTGDPAPDLLPDLAGFLRQQVERVWNWRSQLESLQNWILICGLEDLKISLDLEFLSDSPRDVYLQGVLLGLGHFNGGKGLIPLSNEDWLAILPPGPMPPRDDEVHAWNEYLFVGHWRRTWRGEYWLYSDQSEDSSITRLALRLAGRSLLPILHRRADSLGDLGPKLYPGSDHSWIVEGSPNSSSLTHSIRRQGRGQLGLSLRELIELVRELCLAVRPLHERQLAHGDLRPSCFLLSADPGQPPRVTLVGALEGVVVHDALERQRRGKGRTILLQEALAGDGTLLIASPQLQRGQPATPADDVHALATIIRQLCIGDLLAGRPGGSAWREELLQRKVPVWLIDLLAQCWSDARQDRPQDVLELLDRIDEGIAAREIVFLDEPVLEKHLTVAGCGSRVKALLLERKYPLALHYANRAILLEPDSGYPLYWRACCHFASGQHEAAIEDCTQVVRIEPHHFLGWELRGAAQHALGRLTEAISDLTQAILTHPSRPEPSSYARRAAALFALGRLEEAFSDCEEALREERDNVQALTVRGELARRQGKFVAAIADCTLVLDREPDNREARRTRALAQARHGDYTAALTDFAVCLQGSPEDIELLIGRAQLFAEWKHHEEARCDYEAVLRIDPSHPRALAGFGQVLRRLGS